MPLTRTKRDSLPHAIFLQRVTAQASAASLEARLGQAAFLALRLVDVLAPAREPVSADAFNYQWVATDRFCSELRAVATEGAHVHGIAASAADARRLDDVRLVVPALLAYAHYLEDALRLDEALDVLWTVLDVGGARLPACDSVAVRLRLARVSRKLNRFDEAEAAYTEAGAIAGGAGDRHSQLLSRIGRAMTVLGRGNLSEAERCFRAVLADARAHRDKEAEAGAEHQMAVVLHHMGQPAEAIPHAWRAFELYEDEDRRLRALNDAGLMLLMLGDHVGAERALSEVVRRGRSQDNVSNALIELMHCASYRRDRVGFARWRERCSARAAEMPPNIQADFYLKQGIGHARFGHFQRAETLMQKALEIASSSGLHELEFRIERIKNGLRDCEKALQVEAQAAAEPVFETPELREVSASLAQLVG